MKTVIVVISTYNGAKYIERQLNSIFEQSGVDIQVLPQYQYSNARVLQ